MGKVTSDISNSVSYLMLKIQFDQYSYILYFMVPKKFTSYVVSVGKRIGLKSQNTRFMSRVVYAL